MEIIFDSVKYNCSITIDGEELFFKMESTYPKNIYQEHYSFERLMEISDIFSKNLGYCKERLEELLLNKNSYQIEKENNNLIFHFNLFIFKFDIKLVSKEENFNYNSLPDNIKTIIDKNELTLGIDFGTTNSSASVVIDKEVIIIPNDFGQKSTPSYISFIDDKNYFVGELAKLTPSLDKNTIYGIKRLIGRRYNENYYDKSIDDIKRDQEFPFEIIKDPKSDKVKIVIEYEKGIKIEKKEFYPEQLCALILKKMKVNSEFYLSKKLGKNIIINNAIITVPAYFNQLQREAIKESAKIINLTVKRIINEPTAASLAYGYEKEENENQNTVLVIDFGGGTLDITILSFTKNNKGIFCDINTSNGHSNLGGDDFDLELMKYCLEKNKLDFNIVKNLSKNIRLKRACEKAKIELSSKINSLIKLENYQNLLDLEVSISRDDFYKISAGLFSKFENVLDKILKDYKDSGIKSKISKILLIGGTTFMPKVKEIISQKLPNIEINQNEINTLYGVSKGAAYLGAKESGSNNSKKLYLFDVVNLPLGVEEVGGKMHIFVEKNTKTEFKIEKKAQTVIANQTVANIKIYEGEKPMTKDNFFLGNFLINNLPEKKAGEAKINIIFEYDENSIVKVKAIDLSNENNKEALIVEKPKLYNDAEIKEFNNEVKEMEELYMKDYDAYKYDIIELEEKLNKSKNEEDMLKLIDKFYDLMKKPFTLKVQISFMKYYFWKIHIYLTFLEKNKIQINDSLFKKLENIIDIFSIIQFYDIGQECISNKNLIQINNNNCIVEEIFDDLIDNYELYDKNKLYYICTKIKIINYFEKVKEFIRYIDLNIQGISKIEILNQAEHYLKKAEKTIQKIKKIAFDRNRVEISSFQIILEDLKNLKEILDLEKEIYKDKKMDDLKDDLYEKFLRNSLKYLISKKVYINKNEKKIESYISLSDKLIFRINNIKDDDFRFIEESFFFILEEVLEENEDEDEISILREELYKIKGYFYYKNDIVGKDGRKEEVSSFIYSILALLENKNKIDIYQSIRIYLNKLLEIFKLI